MQQRRPIGHRIAERATGVAFRSLTRLVGLRPEFVPSHLRRQLAVIGIDETALAQVLRNINRLADWPYAWEAEGDRRIAHGDFGGAVSAYYVGQRVLIADTPLKRRLYAQSVEAYLASSRQHELEVLSLRVGDIDVAGYLQLPAGTSASAPAPLILILPGVGSTKEEFDPFCPPLLDAGYAVARIDMPGFGQTTGLVDGTTAELPAGVLAQLHRDARVDPQRTHLFGMSLGAFWSLHTAARTNVSSVVTVSGPHRPHLFFDRLPPMQIEALMRMTGNTSHAHLRRDMERISLGPVVPTITTPVRIFHGTADQTVPVAEAYTLDAELGGTRTSTIYEGVHHNCLEHFDELVAGTIEWFTDPNAVVSRQLDRESVTFHHETPSARTTATLPRAAS